jgi:hypothetical protein
MTESEVTILECKHLFEHIDKNFEFIQSSDFIKNIEHLSIILMNYIDTKLNTSIKISDRKVLYQTESIISKVYYKCAGDSEAITI